jgi:hypothetical protein
LRSEDGGKIYGKDDEDDDKDPNSKDSDDLILTQQPTCGQMHSWQGGGDFDADEDGNYKNDNGSNDKVRRSLR